MCEYWPVAIGMGAVKLARVVLGKLGRAAVGESREVGRLLLKMGARMVAWVEAVTVRWGMGRSGRAVGGESMGDRRAMGDAGAARGDVGARGDGGTRGDGGAPSKRTGDSGFPLTGDGEGGAECSSSMPR